VIDFVQDIPINLLLFYFAYYHHRFGIDVPVYIKNELNYKIFLFSIKSNLHLRKSFAGPILVGLDSLENSRA
jgi:hypothetical protein